MKPILDAFARAELLRLSVKYDCALPEGPRWEDLSIPGMHTPFGISLSTRWDRAFERDPVGTYQMLRPVLAHEFRHWMTIAKHLAIPLPRGPKWREKRREYEEMSAEAFAAQETGITRKVFWDWWNEVTAEVKG